MHLATRDKKYNANLFISNIATHKSDQAREN